MPSMVTGLRCRPALVGPAVVTLVEVARVRPLKAAPGGLGLVTVAALIGLVALGAAVLVLVITFEGSAAPLFLVAKNLSPGVAFFSTGFFSTVVAVVRLLGREDDLMLVDIEVAETVDRFPEWAEIASIKDDELVVGMGCGDICGEGMTEVLELMLLLPFRIVDEGEWRRLTWLTDRELFVEVALLVLRDRL